MDQGQAEHIGDFFQNFDGLEDSEVVQDGFDGFAAAVLLLRDLSGLFCGEQALVFQKGEEKPRVHGQSLSDMVAEITSSGVVMPEATLRMPSSRNVRMPKSRARWRIFETGAFWLIR